MDLLEQREEQIFYHTGIDSVMALPTMQGDNNMFPTDVPQSVEMILKGLCITCDNLGSCDWQHNNKINCQHFQ